MDTDHELEINLSRREIRMLLLHEFRLDHKATEATNNICSTMGEGVLSIRTSVSNGKKFRWNGRVRTKDRTRPFSRDFFPLETLIRTAQNWLNRFRNGNFELDDLPRSGQPSEVNMDL